MNAPAVNNKSRRSTNGTTELEYVKSVIPCIAVNAYQVLAATNRTGQFTVRLAITATKFKFSCHKTKTSAIIALKTTQIGDATSATNLTAQTVSKSKCISTQLT